MSQRRPLRVSSVPISPLCFRTRGRCQALIIVLPKIAIERRHQVVHHLIDELVRLPALALLPEVADQRAAAAVLVGGPRRAVGLAAGHGAHVAQPRKLNLLDKAHERGLLVRPVVREAAAALVVRARGAAQPGVEEVVRARAVLRDDEARVHVQVAVRVRVEVLVRVKGQHEARLGVVLPVVQQPLERQRRVAEQRVLVEEHDNVVRHESFFDLGDFGPRLGPVGDLGRLNKLIVVTVDSRCSRASLITLIG